MLLGGSLLAVVGAALRLRWLTALAAAAVLVAAAPRTSATGRTSRAAAVTPSFFCGYHVDFGAASLLPTLLLLAAALSLPRSGGRCNAPGCFLRAWRPGSRRR